MTLSRSSISSTNLVLVMIYLFASSAIFLICSFFSLISFLLESRAPSNRRVKATSTSLNYSQANWADIDNYLMDIDFSFIDFNENINVSYDMFRSMVQDVCSYFVPVVKIPAYSSPVWFNGEIRHQINKLRTLRKQLKKKWSSTKVARLQSLEASVEKQICASKESYIHSLTTSSACIPVSQVG